LAAHRVSGVAAISKSVIFEYFTSGRTERRRIGRQVSLLSSIELTLGVSLNAHLILSFLSHSLLNIACRNITQQKK